MIKVKIKELNNTGTVKLYENEGFNLEELMTKFDIMFDPELYKVSISKNSKGKYIEITNLQK